MSEGTTEKIIQEAEQTLVPFYAKFARAFVRAKDHFLYDVEGREYVDFSSGIAVVSFGHCNRLINEAIKKQLDEISHISNIFYIPGQAELSKLISERSFTGKTFFCNSGAEANETALKIARMIGNAKSPAKNRALALTGSFHGRTLATITLTGQTKYQKGLEPLLPGVELVEFGSVEDLEKKFDDNVCAIFMEAIQGESGIRPVPAAFAAKAAELAKKYDALVVMDEVQCGIGRSGKYFGYQWLGIEPDVFTMAKALGNGFPIGAAHVRPDVADRMHKGMHASTFGGIISPWLPASPR
jgi:acetylornithine/succinyldiaminopimelate/putrescine aminotransferase